MSEDELKRIEDEGCGCVIASGYGCAAEALVAEVRRLRLLADAATGAVNEGWIDLDDCERKFGPEATAALRKACE